VKHSGASRKKQPDGEIRVDNAEKNESFE